MRRTKAMLVIVALLATPLALFARGMACESCACIMMCCAPQGSHSQHGKGMLCGAKQGMSCGMMNSKRHQPEFGLIAPMAPTFTEAFAAISAPDTIRQLVSFSSQFILQGFASAPFEPPRA
jgi:hypothetical protein